MIIKRELFLSGSYFCVKYAYSNNKDEASDMFTHDSISNGRRLLGTNVSRQNPQPVVPS